MMKVEGKYYVACTSKGEICGEETRKKIENQFTKKYAKASARGLGGLTGACLAVSQLSPRILQMPMNEISEKLFDLKKGVSTHYLNSPAWSIYGLPCNNEKTDLEGIFKKGTAPAFSFK